MARVTGTLKIIRRLEAEYLDAKIALNYSNPLELLIATILSAQCTDEMVNKVTSNLFPKYLTTDDYANANLERFEQEIRSAGFYRNKAKNIIDAAKILVDNFGGSVPQTMTELITLPGVARKTANIVLYNAYGVIEGIAVDTHVKRVSKRLGLTQDTDPEKIEKARKPKYEVCFLNDICPSAFKE